MWLNGNIGLSTDGQLEEGRDLVLFLVYRCLAQCLGQSRCSGKAC